MKSTILIGDAFEQLKALPDGIVNTCVTSPPYFGLRDYGVDGQIGLEATPEQFIQRLVAVFQEVRRVLRDDGTLWVNIGDSYSGSRKGGATHPDNAGNYMQGTNRGLIGKTAVTSVGWGEECKPKDLIGIPWMLAFALRADGWYLRQDIIWAKPNPMPESVRDRCTKSHEYIFLLSKSKQYYYDNDAIAEPIAESTIAFAGGKNGWGKSNPNHATPTGVHGPSARGEGRCGESENGLRNKRSVWTIATKPFKGSHFAVFPPDLIEPCILAGSPVDGIVLDPFTGSGTTGVVALKNRRNFVGTELNPKYVEMAKKRIRREGVYQEIIPWRFNNE